MPPTISNLPELLEACRTSWPAGDVECASHEFGRHGLRADIAAARETDVLIGPHGSGMINGESTWELDGIRDEQR